jgi:hypothetical protein
MLFNFINFKKSRHLWFRLQENSLPYNFDAITLEEIYVTTAKVLVQNGGKNTDVLPYDGSAFSSNVTHRRTDVISAHRAANAETSNLEDTYAKIAKCLAQNQGIDLDTAFMPYDTSVESNLVEEAEAADLAFMFSQLFGKGKGLKDSWFSDHPYEAMPNGLAGVKERLGNLKKRIAH